MNTVRKGTSAETERVRYWKSKGWKKQQELFFSFNERGNIELRE